MMMIRWSNMKWNEIGKSSMKYYGLLSKYLLLNTGINFSFFFSWSLLLIVDVGWLIRPFTFLFSFYKSFPLKYLVSFFSVCICVLVLLVINIFCCSSSFTMMMIIMVVVKVSMNFWWWRLVRFSMGFAHEKKNVIAWSNDGNYHYYSMVV